jgi:hypothetical protein
MAIMAAIMVAAWREKRRNVWHGEMLKWAKEMRIEMKTK